jgi:hypothetical protein
MDELHRQGRRSDRREKLYGFAVAEREHARIKRDESQAVPTRQRE